MKQFDNMAKGLVRLLGLLAAFGMLGAQAQGGEQNSITALSVASTGGGATVIKIELARPLENAPVGFTINTPPRIALDFPNTANGLGKTVQDFNEGDLRSANIVQAGNRTRLVINLGQMLAYDTRIDGNSLLVSLRGKTADRTAAGSVSRFAEAKQGAQKHTLRDVDFRRGRNGEGRIQVDLSDPGIGIDIRQQGAALMVDFLKTGLPRNLQRKLDVIDFATPVQGVDTFAQGDDVRMVIEPKGLWEYAAYQTDNKFIVEVKPVIEDASKPAKGSQAGYVGEKLTLNFQKIDVREALNVIADFTELNMVISDTVRGNLTLRLKDVPWDQALDIILNSRGLDMRKNGNVIQVAPSEEIAAKEKINLTVRQEISELEELRTESFQLSYQTVAEIAKLLTDKNQPILSKRGSTVSDARTGTIFIQDTPARLEEVRKIIKQIDVPVRQVLIEARFVSAGDSFNRTLGGKLSYSGPPVGPGAGDAVGSGSNAMRALLQPNVNLPGATSGVGGLTLSLFNPLATKVLTLELTASELDGRTKNIASPRVVTKDKVAATISSGTQIPYQQATSSGATAVAFKDATLKLTVTPQITPDDHINMQVTANQDTVGAIFSGVPSINTKSVSTEVLVENGGTVVIGGVFTQDITDSTQKVPLLGDVPVVGWLFKNEVKSDSKSELLIFITPRIMKEEISLR
ncbi:MAG: secretin [Gallionellales bacterium RIFCSPLOWO2_12_FULL_59_22]|nr:MAG: secretin [Gallionellales bacterium RIFCSPLOWO2_02_FULL_59_110]OGT05449.1 MAG: secretin [Gallionellales bacterium RIFCSPLOWO2_02_58_13]OGT12069.1 MAG: secretin [Gallionellales bacterium RIFCSPLOWO2_12_FULL_59_22]